MLEINCIGEPIYRRAPVVFFDSRKKLRILPNTFDAAVYFHGEFDAQTWLTRVVLLHGFVKIALGTRLEQHSQVNWHG
jgi:hypothetical protein